jgi:deazaflavin-dependent oxidoreductase (nitroreductase family)
MRSPAALDRPGWRWLLNALSPAPIVVLVHRGRRSGRIYKTPVEALVEDAERGEIVVSPMWGKGSDWYRNVRAGGLIEARRQGKGQPMEWRQLSEEERRQAISTYRHEHPVYSRAILRTLVRLHGLGGDPAEAVIQSVPMLALCPATEGSPAGGQHD